MTLDEMLLRPTAREEKAITQTVDPSLALLLNTKSTKERSVLEQFRTKGEGFREFCTFGTRDECYNKNPKPPCHKVPVKEQINNYKLFSSCTFSR